MLSEALTAITQVGMLVFVVASMAAMGLGLTIEARANAIPVVAPAIP